MGLLRCPFCISDLDERASVCPVCNRDVAVPASLIAEREELLRKRDRIRAELAQARARLAARRRKSAVSDATRA